VFNNPCELELRYSGLFFVCVRVRVLV
jgi:hypothetical protein